MIPLLFTEGLKNFHGSNLQGEMVENISNQKLLDFTSISASVIHVYMPGFLNIMQQTLSRVYLIFPTYRCEKGKHKEIKSFTQQ